MMIIKKIEGVRGRAPKLIGSRHVVFATLVCPPPFTLKTVIICPLHGYTARRVVSHHAGQNPKRARDWSLCGTSEDRPHSRPVNYVHYRVRVLPSRESERRRARPAEASAWRRRRRAVTALDREHVRMRPCRGSGLRCDHRRTARHVARQQARSNHAATTVLHRTPGSGACPGGDRDRAQTSPERTLISSAPAPDSLKKNPAARRVIARPPSSARDGRHPPVAFCLCLVTSQPNSELQTNSSGIEKTAAERRPAFNCLFGG
jgi:hypothetical protein